jgi:hypothetical protein
MLDFYNWNSHRDGIKTAVLAEAFHRATDESIAAAFYGGILTAIWHRRPYCEPRSRLTKTGSIDSEQYRFYIKGKNNAKTQTWTK